MSKEQNIMRLKVIKEIKGLVPGDILTYNEKNDNYEIYKVEEDISESGVTKKTLKVSIGSWLIENFKDYLISIDEEGNEITENKIRWEDSPNYNECEKCSEVVEEPKEEESEISKLTNKIDLLEKELMDIKSYKWIDYNEWKTLRDFYNNHPLNHPFRIFWS